MICPCEQALALAAVLVVVGLQGHERRVELAGKLGYHPRRWLAQQVHFSGSFFAKSLVLSRILSLCCVAANLNRVRGAALFCRKLGCIL